MDPDTPLVVPEVNGGDLEQPQRRRRQPQLHRRHPVGRRVADPPGRRREAHHRLDLLVGLGRGRRRHAGAGGPVARLLAGKEIKRTVFPHQIAFNVFSHNTKVAENGYNEEENKVVEETRKMFHLPDRRDRADLRPGAGAARPLRGDHARAREAAVARGGARPPGQGARREGGR